MKNNYKLALEKTLNLNLNTNFTNSIAENFYSYSMKICQLEALTFQTEENIDELKSCYVEFNNLVKIIETHFPDGKKIQDWRFYAGFYCCFLEWCEEVCFFSLTPHEQSLIWQENPLNTMNYFNF
jgi:hypothetical protein